MQHIFRHKTKALDLIDWIVFCFSLLIESNAVSFWTLHTYRFNIQYDVTEHHYYRLKGHKKGQVCS
jgi:hypothetical protein